MERQNRPVLVKILATDVHRTSLDIASAGIYVEASLAAMSPELRERYFVKNGRSYQVVGDIRQMVVFAPHNITKDAPFTKLDLITCRNLLIYLQPIAQKKALSLFHFGLRTNGVLFLGPSESPGELAGEFDVLEQHWKVYRKRRDIRLPADLRLPLSTSIGSVRGTTSPTMPAAIGSDPHMVGLFTQLLDEALPPSLLVNDQNELVHSFGNAGRYLQLKRGKPSWEVLDMLDGDLRLAVAGALQRASKEQVAINFSGIAMETAGGPEVVGLRVRPVYLPRFNRPYFLISLTTKEDLEVEPEIQPPVNLAEVSRDRVESLESELRYTKENLQATIEELETSNEELQAANQELLASNEELQSTNEELHSVNEELYTVNAEYQKKIAELTELNADMDNLLESTNIHTIFLDKSLRIRKFTPKIAETFNLLPQDIGRRIESFTHSIKHDTLNQDLLKVLETGKAIESEVPGPDNSWFLVRIMPYYKQNVSEGVVLTLIDITQRKKTQKRLREMDAQFQEIIDRSQTLIFVKEVDGAYSMVNRSFEGVVGIPHHQIVGKTDAEIFDDATAKRVQHNDHAVVSSGEPAEFEEVLPHPGGPHTYLSIKIPLRDADGRIRANGGIKPDVTRLKAMYNQARESVGHRDRFLAILSHELRNPLGAILNAATVLERQAKEGECVISPLEVIKRQGRQMAVLLNDLLDVGRITQGKIRLRREIVDVNQLAAAAVETVQTQADEHKHSLELTRVDEPVWVDGDGARLTQVLENLLTNAIKYTPDGGNILVAVTVVKHEVMVSVNDSGHGIPKTMIESIFEMFVQSDNTLDRTNGGMGLGLTLVRELLRLHGGTVTAKSPGPGKGAEFAVRLPRVTDKKKLPKRTSTSEQLRTRNARRVVIVEDNDDSREMLQALLEFEGFEVFVANDGHQGLNLILEQRPHVALVDIGLPGLDGYQIAKEVRAKLKPEQTKLIALTGYGREEDRQAVFDAGFDEHLVKPINTTELTAVLSGKKPTEVAEDSPPE